MKKVTTTFIKLVLWVAYAVCSSVIASHLVSSPSTLNCIFGVIIVILAIVVTFETKCFTTIFKDIGK